MFVFSGVTLMEEWKSGEGLVVGHFQDFLLPKVACTKYFEETFSELNFIGKN